MDVKAWKNFDKIESSFINGMKGKKCWYIIEEIQTIENSENRSFLLC